MSRRCQVVDVDGVPVRVQTDGRAISEEDRAALSALVAAVQAQLDTEPVEVQQARAQRQEEARARLQRLRMRIDADE